MPWTEDVTLIVTREPRATARDSLLSTGAEYLVGYDRPGGWPVRLPDWPSGGAHFGRWIVIGRKTPARYKRSVGLLLTALAIAVRLLWVLVVPTRPVGDFAMYLESARTSASTTRSIPSSSTCRGTSSWPPASTPLGGGLLAIKLIGVAAGGLGTAAVYGTARAIFGRGAAARPACCARSGRRGSPSPA